jgi:hypothetical protein
MSKHSVTRVEGDVWRKKRRKRRVMRFFTRFLFWGIVLVAVFVVGIGFGKTMSSDGGGNGGRVTITRDRGVVTSTQPIKTITVKKTKTIVKTVTKPKD